MKFFGKMICLSTVLLSFFTFANNKVNEVEAVDQTIEKMKQYDENIELGNPYFSNGDFTNPFNSHLMARSGDNSTGLYRGVTSVNEKESDIYALYDVREDNTFVRMGNFNGTGAKRTRMSSYYYDEKGETPLNAPKTDYFDVSFSYRLYATEKEKLTLDGKDIVFRYQSRGSANNKSCDVLLKDLVFNEPADKTWHTYSYRVRCTYSMTTDYGWFFFYYNNASPNMCPTYYADIDNFCVTLGDGINKVKGHGTFDHLEMNDPYLQDARYQDELYNKFFYRADYGDSIYQDTNYGKSFLRMNASKNKSTFSYKMDRDLRNDTTIYINFDYRNLSYYGTPDLDLMINGKEGTVYENVIGKEILSDKFITYVKDVDDKWKNQSFYITVDSGYFNTIDFLLDVGGDLAIDNLVMADFKSINYTSGNYEEFENIYNNFLNTIGNEYTKKYVRNSVKLILNAIEEAEKITEYSSQEKIDKAITAITTALNNLEERGDLQKVLDYIDQIFDEMAGTNKYDYDLRTYILFKYALEAAVALNEDSTKAEIDAAYEALVEAYENLIRKESE